MGKASKININEFDYNLPDKRIAKYPVNQRDHSKLLLYEGGAISEQQFSTVPEILEPGDQLFFNNTRVVQARLEFFKETGARIEIFCLEPLLPVDYQEAYSSTDSVQFLCLVGNARKWKSGSLRLKKNQYALIARMTGRQDDKFIIQFTWENREHSFGEILEHLGSTPIPPYLRRNAEKEDANTYQTVYANLDGSVAAPTAGLHFSKEVLAEIDKKGIPRHELALHVGAGTFIPVKTEDARDHQMHSEQVHTRKSVLKALMLECRNIAVGTTSTRSLESIYWIGAQVLKDKNFSLQNVFVDQWAWQRLKISPGRKEALSALVDKMEKDSMDTLSFQTQIMIVPGYSFRMINGLFTNFHMPKSTLLLLIAALVGDDWRKIYTYAMEKDFRFLSYGDSSLLLPAGN